MAQKTLQKHDIIQDNKNQTNSLTNSLTNWRKNVDSYAMLAMVNNDKPKAKGSE